MKRLYFEWMCGIVCTPKDVRKYSRLLEHLDSVDFYYILKLDENRESDGIDLRYRFGYDTRRDQAEIAWHLDRRPCSVLEMLVAMCIRMDDTSGYNDPKFYFWSMLQYMRLLQYTNKNYDETGVDEKLQMWMDRKYNPKTGVGGLFGLYDNRGEDLTKLDFWQIAMWFINEVEDEVI